MAPPQDATDQPAGKLFKVVAVSQNTNSFGLFGHILLAGDGEAWQAAAGSMYRRKRGDVFTLSYHPDLPGRYLNCGQLGFEIPERLKDAPPEVVQEVW